MERYHTKSSSILLQTDLNDNSDLAILDMGLLTITAVPFRRKRHQ